MVVAPIRLGRNLEVANRLVVAPMTTYSSQPDGRLSEDEPPYLRRRAEGGFGLVMTAACCVHPSGWCFDGQWQCSDDAFLPSLRAMADAIRSGGAKSVLQIHHGGRRCPGRLCGGQPVSASAIPSEIAGAEVPRALLEAEIEEIIRCFADATRRAKTAGFDAVEIHGANTYLLQQFVSPHSNRREDRWGRDRLAFPLAVADAVLEAAGPDFPVGYRFSPEEPETPGIRLSDTFALVEALCERPLAFLHISLRRYDQPSLHDPSSEPVLALVARRIRGRIPLIGVGQIRTKDDAEAAMALGADMVALARSAITDPDWPIEVVAGENREPHLCVPQEGAARKLTIPAGLERRICDVEGWFCVEGRWEQNR